MKEPLTIPPRRRAPDPHPLDPVIEVLSGLSTAVREMRSEVVDALETLGARVNGQSRAMQDLADEVRAFGSSKERLAGRIAALELLEDDRRHGNGNGTA